MNRWLQNASVWICLLLAVASDCSGQEAATDRTTVLVVVGAPGEQQYGKNFVEWAGHWEEAARKAQAKWLAIGLDPEQPAATDRDRLEKMLSDENKKGRGELWVVLLGHGTFDRRQAKFNLRGPDFSAEELAEWLKPFERPVAVINTSASSAPFISALSGPRRVVISATRSGSEENYARLGKYLSESIADPAADLDKDGQTSLLEAFLVGSRKTVEYYESENRLATEHSLIDDNGDRMGTPADWFRGTRATKKAKDGSGIDGLRAHQWHLVRSAAEQSLPAEVRARRDELELSIARLRDEKATMSEEEYYQQLEKLLLELARVRKPTAAGL